MTGYSYRRVKVRSHARKDKTSRKYLRAGYGYRHESETTPEGRKFISAHIKKHKREGMSQDQAVAAAYSEARSKGYKVPKRKGGKK